MARWSRPDLTAHVDDWIGKLVLGLLAAGALAALFRPRYRFELDIRNHEPQVRVGRVTKVFLDNVRTVCRDEPIETGWIGGIAHGPRTRLRFSREFSPGAQQQLRNAWQAGG